ncbi:hypothetical protein OC844_006139 [Tilletia horrida]|nr:hypothetical protein OC844_006139 [Tilletia horrida]
MSLDGPFAPDVVAAATSDQDDANNDKDDNANVNGEASGGDGDGAGTADPNQLGNDSPLRSERPTRAWLAEQMRPFQPVLRTMLPLPYWYLTWAFKRHQLLVEGKGEPSLPLTRTLSLVTGLPVSKPLPSRRPTTVQRAQVKVESFERACATFWPGLALIFVLLLGGLVGSIKNVLLIFTGLAVFSPFPDAIGPSILQADGTGTPLLTAVQSSSWLGTLSRWLLQYWAHFGITTFFVVLSWLWPIAPQLGTACAWWLTNAYGEETTFVPFQSIERKATPATTNGHAQRGDGASSTAVQATSTSNAGALRRRGPGARPGSAEAGNTASPKFADFQKAIVQLQTLDADEATIGKAYRSASTQLGTFLSDRDASVSMHAHRVLSVQLGQALDDHAHGWYEKADQLEAGSSAQEAALEKATLFEVRCIDELLRSGDRSRDGDELLEDAVGYYFRCLEFAFKVPIDFDKSSGSAQDRFELEGRTILERLQKLKTSMSDPFWYAENTDAELRMEMLVRTCKTLLQHLIDESYETPKAHQERSPRSSGQTADTLSIWLLELIKEVRDAYRSDPAVLKSWDPIEANILRLAAIRDVMTGRDEEAKVKLTSASALFTKLERMGTQLATVITGPHADVDRMIFALAHPRLDRSALREGNELRGSMEQRQTAIQAGVLAKRFEFLPEDQKKLWSAEYGDCLRMQLILTFDPLHARSISGHDSEQSSRFQGELEIVDRAIEALTKRGKGAERWFGQLGDAWALRHFLIREEIGCPESWYGKPTWIRVVGHARHDDVLLAINKAVDFLTYAIPRERWAGPLGLAELELVGLMRTAGTGSQFAVYSTCLNAITDIAHFLKAPGSNEELEREEAVFWKYTLRESLVLFASLSWTRESDWRDLLSSLFASTSSSSSSSSSTESAEGWAAELCFVRACHARLRAQPDLPAAPPQFHDASVLLAGLRADPDAKEWIPHIEEVLEAAEAKLGKPKKKRRMGGLFS